MLRRRIFVLVTSAIGIPALLFWSYMEPGWAHFAMALSAGAVLLTVTLVLSGLGLMEMVMTRVTMAFVCLLLLMLLDLDRGAEDLLWFSVVPLITVFLFGVIPGSIWSVTFLVATLLLGTGAFGGAPKSMLMEANLDFLLSYVIVLLFSVCFEMLRERARNRADTVIASLRREHDNLQKAHAELDVLERRLVEYNHVATDWLYEIDADYRISFLSKRFEQIFSVAPEAIVGMSIFELLDNYDDCDRQMHRDRLLRREPFKDFKYSVSLPGGERRYFMTRGEPQYDRDGEFRGYIGSGTDMTDYERAQIEVRRRDRRLQHVQRLDAIGQLTSGIAHDFNNLLMVVNGNVELLNAGLDEHRDELLDAIATAARQGSELTAKLLSFSRDAPLQVQTVDVSDVFGDVLGLLRHTLGDGIDMVSSVDSSLPLLQVDPAQLESALVNLAINGRDAMKGNGRLELGAREQQLDNQEGIEFFVRDEGAGIPSEIVDRVVEPFFTTKPQGKGTGLGLSMVYGFATQSGGDLKIESEPGQGTLVRLWLPVASGTEYRQEELEEQAPGSLQAMRILVVEDDARVREIVLRMLRVLGQASEVCVSSEAALDLLGDPEQPGIDVVLTDIMLGSGMDGTELAGKILSRYPDIAVILMSGYPERSADSQLVQQLPLLNKPFGLRSLGEALATAQQHIQGSPG